MMYSRYKSAFLFLALSILIMKVVFAQSTSAGQVSCSKLTITEPLTFYGNMLDNFTLSDGTRWKVITRGPVEFIPARYRDVLICPTEGILVIDKKALSVEKLSAK